MTDLLLREEHREELSEPRGVLLRGSPVPPAELRLFLDPPVIAVGDVVAETLLHAGLRPALIIYDEATRRGRYDSPELGSIEADHVVINPRSTISQEAQELFSANPRGTILAKGEEDLLVIPAAISAEPGSTLVYGQPGEGVVVLKVDDMLRGFLELYLASFEPAVKLGGEAD